jgi:hypothetical protein
MKHTIWPETNPVSTVAAETGFARSCTGAVCVSRQQPSHVMRVEALEEQLQARSQTETISTSLVRSSVDMEKVASTLLRTAASNCKSALVSEVCPINSMVLIPSTGL